MTGPDTRPEIRLTSRPLRRSRYPRALRRSVSCAPAPTIAAWSGTNPKLGLEVKRDWERYATHPPWHRDAPDGNAHLHHQELTLPQRCLASQRLSATFPLATDTLTEIRAGVVFTTRSPRALTIGAPALASASCASKGPEEVKLRPCGTASCCHQRQ